MVIALLNDRGYYGVSVVLGVLVYYGIPLTLCVVVINRVFRNRLGSRPSQSWLNRAIFFALLLCGQAVLATMYHTSNDLFLNMAFLFAVGLSVSCYQYRTTAPPASADPEQGPRH